MFTKILLAIDQSEFSERAIEKTLGLAKSTGASVFVIHVVPPISAYYPALAPFAPIEPSGAAELTGAHAETERRAQALLDKTHARFDEHGISCTMKVSQGYPAEEICAEADAQSVDLIVLGRRGLGAVASFFLGGVSQKVITHTRHSILLVQ